MMATLIIPVILSGMVKGVAIIVLAVSLICLHDSRQHYQRLPVMILNFVCATKIPAGVRTQLFI